ncbi:MAG TPA: hypothetical protein VE619_08770 [Nitrososphaeraceae archaeon]|nr:hypothetical protein [Nitrososphaeraceae archaeon]
MTSGDNREKLHEMELFKDTHSVKFELLSCYDYRQRIELHKKQTGTATKEALVTRFN